jgi:hypothetical protein
MTGPRTHVLRCGLQIFHRLRRLAIGRSEHTIGPSRQSRRHICSPRCQPWVSAVPRSRTVNDGGILRPQILSVILHATLVEQRNELGLKIDFSMMMLLIADVPGDRIYVGTRYAERPEAFLPRERPRCFIHRDEFAFTKRMESERLTSGGNEKSKWAWSTWPFAIIGFPFFSLTSPAI